MKGLITKERTDDQYFYGEYKGYLIDIDRDEDHGGDFYIMVFNDGGYLYDGWWDDSKDATIDDAIKEALQGAEL